MVKEKQEDRALICEFKEERPQQRSAGQIKRARIFLLDVLLELPISFILGKRAQITGRDGKGRRRHNDLGRPTLVFYKAGSQGNMAF